MHGWISIPWTWQLVLLALAPVVGFALGAWGARSKRQIVLWLGYTLAYSLLAVLVAFLYETHGFAGLYVGHYDMVAWGILVVPVFLYGLPTIGLPWALARRLMLSWSSQMRADGAEVRSVVSVLLLVIGALELAVVTAVVLKSRLLPIPQSTYVIPPIDPAQAPSDLTEVTNGSEWSCTVLKEGKPTNSVIDYHFDALDVGARWQSFSHRDELRPFFDLDHAKGIEQFFSGPYSIIDRKLHLGSDYAGMRLGSTHQFSKNDQDAMLARHDPRLHGELLVQPNGLKGTIEVVSFRSLSTTTMSLVVDYSGDVPRSLELACRRVHDSNFQPIATPPLS